MTATNFSDYKLSELKDLQFAIEREIKVRRQQEVKLAREKILAIAEDLGVSVIELLSNVDGKSRGRPGTKVPQQYRNPADNSQTWSGRGRQPKWVADGLANGKTLNDFRI